MENKEKKNYEVYGDVQLTDKEVNCLELGLKYMVTPTLEREGFEVEVEIESVKTRLLIQYLQYLYNWYVIIIYVFMYLCMHSDS